MESFQELINRALKLITFQNLSFVLGLIGSLGTAWNIFQNRKRISIKLLCFGINSSSHTALAYMQFVNKSRLPISITDVSIVIDGTSFPCEKIPVIAYSNKHERAGQKTIKDFYSASFPIQLGNLGGTSGFLVFELPPDIHITESTPQTFEVCTNRGKSKEFSLQPLQEYFR